MAFIDWEIPVSVHGRKLSKNEVSLCLTGRSKSLTFNQEVSFIAKQKGYLRLSIKQDDITGDIGFELHNDVKRGVNLSITGGRTHKNLVCQRKLIIEKLLNELKLEKDVRNVVKITDNLSKIDRCLFYRVINKQ